VYLVEHPTILWHESSDALHDLGKVDARETELHGQVRGRKGALGRAEPFHPVGRASHQPADPFVVR
jgi:hypothetical protein